MVSSLQKNMGTTVLVGSEYDSLFVDRHLGRHVGNDDCGNSGHEFWGLFVPHQHFA